MEPDLVLPLSDSKEIILSWGVAVKRLQHLRFAILKINSFWGYVISDV